MWPAGRRKPANGGPAPVVVPFLMVRRNPTRRLAKATSAWQFCGRSAPRHRCASPQGANFCTRASLLLGQQVARPPRCSTQARASVVRRAGFVRRNRASVVRRASSDLDPNCRRASSVSLMTGRMRNTVHGLMLLWGGGLRPSALSGACVRGPLVRLAPARDAGAASFVLRGRSRPVGSEGRVERCVEACVLSPSRVRWRTPPQPPARTAAWSVRAAHRCTCARGGR